MEKKIISMSVWGDDPRYIKGALRQTELAKKYYPEWEVRIYTDDPSNFKNTNAEVVSPSSSSIDCQGAFWRFLPMFEDENNIVMVRDSDGRTTIREARAVNEWLESGKSFHTFRDHEAHYEYPIIACAFAYRGKLPKELLTVMNTFERDHTYYLGDQIYLRDYVWPYVKFDSLVHSMFDEGWFAETRNRLKNKYSFCGNGYNENDLPLYSDSLTTIKDFVTLEKNKFDEGVLDDL